MKKSVLVMKRDPAGKFTEESFSVEGSPRRFKHLQATVWILLVGEFLLYLAVARLAYLLGI